VATFERARVARFYGWTHDYIMSMPYKEYRNYLKSIDAVISSEYHNLRNIASYPEMNKKGRDKLDKAMKSIYNRIVEGNDSPVTPKEQAMALLRKMRNGG